MDIKGDVRGKHIHMKKRPKTKDTNRTGEDYTYRYVHKNYKSRRKGKYKRNK